jgi:hypothetical protein
MEHFLFQLVMAGLVPAIHVLIATEKKGVDARDKPGHDGQFRCARSAKAPLRGWQDTIAGRTPVQPRRTLPHCALPE